jgi:glutathione synthase/RimK-type ligase-like ATP-grasp enzyme
MKKVKVTTEQQVQQLVKQTSKKVAIFSRHPTHDVLRGKLVSKVTACIRLGSTTESDAAIQINSEAGVRTSSDKRAMKAGFARLEVKTPKAALYTRNFVINTREQTINWKVINELYSLKFPIVLKNRFGSRGTGNSLFKTAEDFNANVLDNPTRNWDNYIIEEYMNYGLEYRIHASPVINAAFYACRKALKKDVPEELKWQRHDDTCVWFLPDTENFKRPANWEEIEAEAIKAVAACGLDFGACDIRVSAKADEHGRQSFTIIEVNSAPSFGDVTAQKYLEVLPAIIQAKNESRK